VLHEEQEAFQDRPGLFLEKTFLRHLEQFTAHAEALVQHPRRVIGLRQEACFQVLQHDGIGLGDSLCRAVVRLHEDFARPALLGVGVAKLRGKRALQIED
jgi:hypothetical protein